MDVRDLRTKDKLDLLFSYFYNDSDFGDYVRDRIADYHAYNKDCFIWLEKLKSFGIVKGFNIFSGKIKYKLCEICNLENSSYKSINSLDIYLPENNLKMLSCEIYECQPVKTIFLYNPDQLENKNVIVPNISGYSVEEEIEHKELRINFIG